MINTQIAFLTATALGNISEAINLDALKESYGVEDELEVKAERATDNHLVRTQINKSIASIVNYVKNEGVELRDIYAATSFSGNNISTANYNVSSGTTTYSCHGNCHGNCHGSRGWR